MRKDHELEEIFHDNQDQVTIEAHTQDAAAAPPQLAVEVDSQLVQAGECCFATVSRLAPAAATCTL